MLKKYYQHITSSSDKIKQPHGYTGPTAVAIHNTMDKQDTMQQYGAAISMENTSPQSRKCNEGYM